MPSADYFSIDTPEASTNTLQLDKKSQLITFASSSICYQLAVTLLCLTILLFPAINAMAMKPFRIGTGGSTGVYYPIGKLIASGLTLEAKKNNSTLKNFIGVAQNSAGSIDNVQSILSGEIEAGLVQADIAAFTNNDDLASAKSEKRASLRAIASLYSEKFQIAVRKDAKIRTFLDLKGKKISVDELRSGTLSVMKIILKAHKITENDLLPLYLKPVFTHDKLQNGQLHGFVMMAGAPMDAVTQLLETGITLVPIAPSIAADINRQYPYLFPGKIEENVYPGIAETPTLEVFALLVVSEQMPDEIAYAITKTLFNEETSKLFQEGHSQSQSITLDTALDGISIPLHPGAESFYREKKLLN